MILRTCDMEEFIKRIEGRDVVCFGAGKLLSDFCEEFCDYSLEKQITYIVDNNPSLWGEQKCLNGTKIDIKEPDSLYKENSKGIIILITCSEISAFEIYSSLDVMNELSENECYIASFLKLCQYDAIAYKASKAPEGYRMNTSPVIPKKIHYCWVGGNPIPEKNRKCIESWKRFCPDYEIIEWNEMNYDFSKNKYMNQAYTARKWGFVPDFARLDIVYTHGGVYLDVDVEVIRPLDELLYNDAFCGFESLRYINLGSGFGGVKGVQIFKSIMDSYNEMLFLKEDGELNLTASPIIQTNKLSEYGLKRHGGFQTLNGLAVYPVEYFSPLNLRTRHLRKTPNTFSIHWYDGSWLNEEQHYNSSLFTQVYSIAVDNEKKIGKN